MTTASGEVITTLTVTQEGTVLNLSESEITLGQEADSLTQISVTSDTEWTWTDDASWITSTEGSPQNGAFFFNNIISFDFAVTENTTGAPRVGTITFTSDQVGVLSGPS